MIPSFDQFQKYGQENMEAAIQAVGTFSKGAQAIAAEISDFARKAFERNSTTIEQLAGAKTIEKAVEIQTDYVKGAYEGLVSQSTKLGAALFQLRHRSSEAHPGSLLPRSPQLNPAPRSSSLTLTPGLAPGVLRCSRRLGFVRLPAKYVAAFPRTLRPPTLLI